MKFYRFEDKAGTWWVEYRCDGMENSDEQTLLSFKAEVVGNPIDVLEITDTMKALGLPSHIGYRFTDVEFKLLAVAKNLNLYKRYEANAESTLSSALNVQVTPTFSPVAGPIAFGSRVVISSAGADNIYYTLDGTVPSDQSTDQAVTDATITEAGVLKAIAYKDGLYHSLVASAVYTQADAAAPTSVALTVGAVNPVGGVTDVALPAGGGTDTTGAVTGWATGTADTIAFTVVDSTGTSTITINGAAYTSGDDYVIAAATPLTIVVTTVETGTITQVRTFTVSVTAA